MKSKLMITAFMAVVGVSGVIGLNKFHSSEMDQLSGASSIEALSTCESIGWWDNDGNCVKNSETEDYFCKDDDIFSITDCKR
ncbi:MAG: hypothetical protein HDS35_04920 [Bacteroides sp.]|nr:hypothetical protein [Bacteroides sp.]